MNVCLQIFGCQLKPYEAAWHEASCGTLSFFDKDGERLSTCYYGRRPESKKSTLKKLLKNHLESVIKQRPDLKIIYVADGAQDNWTFFTQGGQAILTFRALIKSHCFEKARDSILRPLKERRLRGGPLRQPPNGIR